MIEFKRDSESEDVAVWQVYTVGTWALFNWYSLYAEAWKVKSNLMDDVTNVQYYTLTFVEHKFVFWVLQPTRHEAGWWTGCVMKRLPTSMQSESWLIGLMRFMHGVYCNMALVVNETLRGF